MVLSLRSTLARLIQARLGRGDLSEFATKTMIFPVFIVTLLARWALSRVLPFKHLGLVTNTTLPGQICASLRPWSIFKTLNTMGVILPLGLVALSDPA